MTRPLALPERQVTALCRGAAKAGHVAEQCIAAGVPGRAHGLRKAGATFAAENGATDLQLAAMFGWRNPRMAEVYTKKASRKRLAEQAANALFPHLESGAGVGGENTGKSRSKK